MSKMFQIQDPEAKQHGLGKLGPQRCAKQDKETWLYSEFEMTPEAESFCFCVTCPRP